LGSAAGVFAVAGAQAADLPVKAKPVEYVKVCSLYGAGFWYVPGTDTCIKVGALTKLEVEYNATGGGAPLGNGNAGGRFTRVDTNMLGWRSRGDISFDIREQTEYGTLRSYIDVGQTTETASGPSNGSATIANNSTGGTISIHATRAFLQFAGFTAGRMRSFFDMYFQGAYAFASQRFQGDTTANGIAGIAYTWQFGGGVSASFSVEDGGFGTGGRNRSTANLAAGGQVIGGTVTGGGIIGGTVSPAFTIGAGTADIKGQQVWDPVVNLRIDQAWGFAGVSAAAHDASGGYFGTLTTTGHPSDIFGWAVTAAVQLTSPFGLRGDTLGSQAVFTRGASGYAVGTGLGAGVGANALFGSGNNIGVGWLSEGIYSPAGGSVQLTDVWSFVGAYEHRWNPQWRSSIYGGMAGVIYNDTAKNIICANPAAPLGFVGTGGFTAGTVTNCNPNFSATQLGSRTLWNPVPNIDVGFDLSWVHLNTAFAGAAVLNNAVGARPAGAYTITNQDALSAFFRFQRNFLY
jgi:hypothetical protein